MPLHDWSRVDPGTYHSFHHAWIAHLSSVLNGGPLPEGCYALSEEHGGRRIAYIPAPHEPRDEAGWPPDCGGLSVSEAPPRVGCQLALSEAASYRTMRRTLAIRHESGHRVVALVEIASPGNKDRDRSVGQFVEKVAEALEGGVHVLVIDPLPAGPHDPEGLNGAIWASLGLVDEGPADRRFPTLASYVAGRRPEAYVEPVDLGGPLPEMPLFLTPRTYINVPLEPTYDSAYRGLPGYWRAVIEGIEPPPR